MKVLGRIGWLQWKLKHGENLPRGLGQDECSAPTHNYSAGSSRWHLQTLCQSLTSLTCEPMPSKQATVTGVTGAEVGADQFKQTVGVHSTVGIRSGAFTVLAGHPWVYMFLMTASRFLSGVDYD